MKRLAVPFLALALTACGGATQPLTHTPSSSTTPWIETQPSDPAPTFTASPEDFRLGVKVLSKECFGSAGCNITFRIVPTYTGSASLPSSGTVEVTYDVKGGQDPITNTFTIEDGSDKAMVQEEEMAQTANSSKKLKAVVTAVEYIP